jgi:hypothetical protein
MIVGGVAVGALSIASAFTLFQFMRRGSGPSSDPTSGSKSTPVTETGLESETEVGSETIVELEPRLSERPFERSSEASLILPSQRPSTLTSETSNPLTYLSIDPAHVDEITQFLTALKKRSGVVQTQ